MKNLNAMIRQTKQQIIDNLDDNFHPINLEIDTILESKLYDLYKQREQKQIKKIDSLSNMYLRLYA
jgi:ribonuclease HIII